jgi:hypothetical protein
MERFWRAAGVQLGKYWWAVLGSMLVITGLLALGLSQLQFATGQDSYLNQDSQIAVDNVEYQDNFGGETAILLFQAQDGNDITDLFDGENLEELQNLEEELGDIPEVFAVVAPLTAVQYSENIVTEGVGTNALLSAADRDPDPASVEVRQADTSCCSRTPASNPKVARRPRHRTTSGRSAAPSSRPSRTSRPRWAAC